MLGLWVASSSRFGPSGCVSVSTGTPRSEARYWSEPPSVWPMATGRTPRRAIVEAVNGVSAATRGAAWAGTGGQRGETEGGDECGEELHGTG